MQWFADNVAAEEEVSSVAAVEWQSDLEYIIVRCHLLDPSRKPISGNEAGPVAKVSLEKKHHDLACSLGTVFGFQKKNITDNVYAHGAADDGFVSCAGACALTARFHEARRKAVDGAGRMTHGMADLCRGRGLQSYTMLMANRRKGLCSVCCSEPPLSYLFASKRHRNITGASD